MASVDTVQAPKAPSAPQKDYFAPVTFKLDDVVQTPMPKTRRYWIGVTSDAPFATTSKAGLDFQMYVGPTPADDAGHFDPSMIRARGMIRELTDDQIEVVVRRVKNTVLEVDRKTSDSVGKDGVRRSSFIVTKWKYHDAIEYDRRRDAEGKSQNPRPMVRTPNDVPLGCYLYCIPVAESMPVGWRDNPTPTRMCEFPAGSPWAPKG